MDFPKTFQAAGHTWLVEITTATLKRVKNATGFLFDSLIGEPSINGSKAKRQEAAEASLKPLQDFLNDTERFSDVLFVILKPALETKGIAQERFDEALFGETLAEARQAFLAGLFDFFPDPQKKMILLGLLEETKEQTRRMKVATTIAMEELTARIKPMPNDEIRAVVQASLAEVFLSTATDSAASPESIQAPSA